MNGRSAKPGSARWQRRCGENNSRRHLGCRARRTSEAAPGPRDQHRPHQRSLPGCAARPDYDQARAAPGGAFGAACRNRPEDEELRKMRVAGPCSQVPVEETDRARTQGGPCAGRGWSPPCAGALRLNPSRPVAGPALAESARCRPPSAAHVQAFDARQVQLALRFVFRIS